MVVLKQLADVNWETKKKLRSTLEVIKVMTQNSFFSHNIQEENKSLFVIRIASILAERAPMTGFLTRLTKSHTTWARLAPRPSTGTHSSHPVGRLEPLRCFSAHWHHCALWCEGSETRQF